MLEGATYNTVLGSTAFSGIQANNNSDHCVAIGYLALSGALDGADGTVAIGSSALAALTSGAGNAAIGYNAGAGLTSGAGNTVIGHTALDLADTALNCVAIGKDAMTSIPTSQAVDGVIAIGTDALAGAAGTTTGINGTVAIGKQALVALTTGGGNIAIGYQSSLALTTGEQNIAVGYQALAAITDASANIMIGYQAGVAAEDAGFAYNIGIGNNVFDGVAADVDTVGNVAIGHNSMTGTLVDTADYNTCVGYNTGQVMTGGYSNVLLGAGAGTALSTGYQNIIIGRDTATGCDDDYNHVVIGHMAGTVLDSGNSCVLIGRDTEPSTAAAANQIVIGADTTGQADNTVTLGNASVTDVYMASDSGALVHSAGIQFAGTQVANAGANVFDDYEEGTWTPTLVATDTNWTAIGYHGDTGGLYTKIGRVVHVQGAIRVSSLTMGSAAGDVYIGALPFTPVNTTTEGDLNGIISKITGFAGEVPIAIHADRNTTTLTLYFRADSDGVAAATQAADIDASVDMHFSATFIAA